MAIYIAAHKKVDMPSLKKYVPIQVGAALHDDLGYQKDNIGDNISDKNPYYCELTALYWIWKNVKSQENVGLVHYRRYFSKRNKIMSYDQMCKELKDCDVIVPKKWFFYNNVEQHYGKMHHIKDLYSCEQVVRQLYPDYSAAYQKVMHRKYLYLFNMFFMRHREFEEYMRFLFDVLFELEKQIDISNYNTYDQRVFGFLSERLFNVWLEKKQLRVLEINVFNTEASLKERILLALKNEAKRIISFI